MRVMRVIADNVPAAYLFIAYITFSATFSMGDERIPAITRITRITRNLASMSLAVQAYQLCRLELAKSFPAKLNGSLLEGKKIRALRTPTFFQRMDSKCG